MGFGLSQISGVTLFGVGLTFVTAFARWRLPKIPHFISSPGVAIGVGLMVAAASPGLRLGTVAAGIVALALAAFAIEWQLRAPATKTGNSEAVPAPPKTDPTAAAPASQVKTATAPPRTPAHYEGAKPAAAASSAPDAGPWAVDSTARNVTIERNMFVGAGVRVRPGPSSEGATSLTVRESTFNSSAPAEAAPTHRHDFSTEGMRGLVAGLFEMRNELGGVWVTRADNSPVFGQIMDALKRANIEFVSDSQNPSNPSQTGVVICVPDPAHPSVTAKKLHALFQQTGVPTSYDAIADRQRSRKGDAPSLVIYAAPPPL